MLDMKKFFSHFFLPSESNNYRPRILHHKILLIFTLFFFSAGFLMSFLKYNLPSVLGTYSNISNDQLLLLTNEKRQENGESPLVLNSQLSQAALNKANDMFAKNYWAHNAPDGTTPWVFIKGSGYNYVYAGENLARGFTTAPDVVNAWMASPEHKKNVLSPNYKDIGFAVETGNLNGEDTVLVVEMFGSTYLAPAPIAQNNQNVPQQVASGSPTSLNVPQPNTLAQTNQVPEPKNATKTTLATSQIKPLVNSASVSLISARVFISIFIFILLLDMVIIERRKIVRFVGHNLDHVLFFTLMLIIIFVLAKGLII